MESLRKLCLSLFATTLLSSAPVLGDVYLSIPGVQGESVNEAHEGWVVCESVQFGVERTAEGRTPEFSRLTLTRGIDSNSPELFVRATSATVDPAVTIEFTDSVGDVNMAIQLRNAVVVEYSVSIADGGEAVETIRLSFTHMTLAVYPRDPRSGESLKPVVRGWSLSAATRDDTLVK